MSFKAGHVAEWPSRTGFEPLPTLDGVEPETSGPSTTEGSAEDSGFCPSSDRYPILTASIETEPPSTPWTGKLISSLPRHAAITYSRGR